MTTASTFGTQAPRFDLQRIARVATYAAWPFAIAVALHLVFVDAVNGAVTDDFTTVWNALQKFIHGEPVYTEQYWTVDPHYLYSPGGTLLLSPWALLPDFDTARMLFIIVNALAVVGGLALLTRAVGLSLRGPALPLGILAAFLTESVTNTLIYSNINGVLFLLVTGYLLALRDKRPWLAGLLLGVGLTIKPVVLLLYFLPLVKWRTWWPAFISGAAVTVLSNGIGALLMTAPRRYVTELLPYLGEVRDFSNASISGQGVYFGVPEGWILFWRIVVGLMVATALLVLLRWRDTDELFWLLTSSGLLLLAGFSLTSLGQQYYSMLLFPMLYSVFLRRSVFHNPVAWLAAALFLVNLKTHIYRIGVNSMWAGWAFPAIGWVLLIAVSCFMTLWWVAEDKAALNSGHDERNPELAESH